jgi:hypothetical protein
MEEYKINRQEDIKNFVATTSYNKLLESFQKLPLSKGHIVHVVGAPGTGKSTNIYSAMEELDLNFYEVKLILPSLNLRSRDIFTLMLESIKDDLGINHNNSVFSHLDRFDAVLFADQFHDSHLTHKGKFGFSQWTAYNGLNSFNFYVICVNEYLKHRNDFKDVNMVLQTAWRFRMSGKKRDIFTDMGPFSSLAVAFMKVPFEVVEISYSEEETINIVKSHLCDADPDEIKLYIKKYGNKPRFICEAMKTSL